MKHKEAQYFLSTFLKACQARDGNSREFLGLTKK